MRRREEPSPQDVNSARAIFDQARVLHDVDGFDSKDPRLPRTLNILGLPPSLIEALDTVDEEKTPPEALDTVDEETARRVAEARRDYIFHRWWREY